MPYKYQDVVGVDWKSLLCGVLIIDSCNKWENWPTHVGRLDDSLQREAGQGRVHAEMESGYEEVVGVVVSAKWRKNVLSRAELEQKNIA